MENSYESGFAFVLEGATERVFYERLLYFFARKYPNCSWTIWCSNYQNECSWNNHPDSQFSELAPKQLCPGKGKENSMDGFSLL